MTPATLRQAGARDFRAIVDVFWACWTISYAAALPAELVSRLDRYAAEALWVRALSDPVTSTVVAVDDRQRVIGVTRWSDDTVHSLYVHPDAQGDGTGRHLLARAESAIAADGFNSAHLWVFDGNAPALAFYARQGWSADGTTRTDPVFGRPELRLRKEIGPS
jgi:GNAT superfamily N-acetyltransferase